MILITGALGTVVISHLLTKLSPNKIVVLVRSEQKAEPFRQKGIKVRIGNYNDIDSLEDAMKDITKVLLISSPDGNDIFLQHKNVIDAAKKHNVKHLVYTSLLVKNIENSPLRALLQQHLDTEAYLIKIGIGFTILKNSMYADAIPLFVGKSVFEKGVYLHANQGKVPFVLRRELGEVAAHILLDDIHLNKEYELTAERYYTYSDVASVLSALSRQEIPFYPNVSAMEYERYLIDIGYHASEIPLVSGFVTDQRDGVFEMQSEDLAFILGRQPLSLSESLKEIYQL